MLAVVDRCAVLACVRDRVGREGVYVPGGGTAVEYS